MLPNVISMIVTMAAGALIAFVNYSISKHILIKSPDKYSFTVVIHQMLQVAFLAAVYFIASGMTTLNVVYPLVGSVLGMTAPMFFFTKKLLSLNSKKETVKTETEDDADGREI